MPDIKDLTNEDIENLAYKIGSTLVLDPERILEMSMVENNNTHDLTISSSMTRVDALGTRISLTTNTITPCVEFSKKLKTISTLQSLTQSGINSELLSLETPTFLTINNFKFIPTLLPHILPNLKTHVTSQEQGNEVDQNSYTKFEPNVDSTIEYRNFNCKIDEMEGLIEFLKKHPFYIKALAQLPIHIKHLGHWNFGDLMLDWKIRPLLYRGIVTHSYFTPFPYNSKTLLNESVRLNRETILPQAILCALAPEGLSPAVASDMLYPVYTGTRRNSMINNSCYLKLKKHSEFGSLPYVQKMPIFCRRRITGPDFTSSISRDMVRYIYLFLDVYRSVSRQLSTQTEQLTFNAFDLIVTLRICRMFMQAEFAFTIAQKIEEDLKKGVLIAELNKFNLKPFKLKAEENSDNYDLASFYTTLSYEDFECIYNTYCNINLNLKKRMLINYVSHINSAVYAALFADIYGKEFMYLGSTQFLRLPSYIFVHGEAPLNDLLYYNVPRTKENIIKQAIQFALK